MRYKLCSVVLLTVMLLFTFSCTYMGALPKQRIMSDTQADQIDNDADQDRMFLLLPPLCVAAGVVLGIIASNVRRTVKPKDE